MNRIALFRGTGMVERLIRLQTRSQYSHAAILRPDDTVIEAVGSPFPRGAVRHVDSISTQHSPGIEVDIFSVAGPFDDERADFWAAGTIGLGYDYRSVARFVTRRPADENRRYFCSEHVFSYWLAGGVRLLGFIEPHNVSPRDLSVSPLLRFIETRVTE